MSKNADSVMLSLIDPNAPGVVDDEVVDRLAYYGYRAPLMADYQIEFFYADAKTCGDAEMMAIFEDEGVKRGVDLSPLPDVVIWRKDEATGDHRREVP
jgi:hypothetical protein